MATTIPAVGDLVRHWRQRLSELAIEAFLPADADTAALLRAFAESRA